VNWKSYAYQSRITGFAYDTEACQWSDEWQFDSIDFDGFQAMQCLLQEAKGDYDQFLDGSKGSFERIFKGFDDMRNTALKQDKTMKK